VAFWATVVVVVVLLAYLLSIGPIAWFADHGLLPEIARQPLRFFYHPLVWAVLQSGVAINICCWYLSLCGHDFEPEPVGAA
jgi:hypothetical protein